MTAKQSPAYFTPSILDPSDWDEFRDQAHRLLDTCIDRLENSRDYPWRPMSQGDKSALSLGDASRTSSNEQLVDDLENLIMPFATGNTHPRFFGWVHGTGLASSLLASMVEATMNSNCGGRDHGAIYTEQEVIEWCKRCFSFPAEASGLLVTGTSQATVIALACARQNALGKSSRKEGIQGEQRLVGYAANGVHIAASKAFELLGLGNRSLRKIPCDPGGAMNCRALQEKVSEDRGKGLKPFCVIGTAGSVDTGAFDNLAELSDFCSKNALWFHVDGAFGAWARLADPPWRDLVNGMELADSLAFDFHKWMFVQYDCGAVLVRNPEIHRSTFSGRPSYLSSQNQGLGGGEPWFCDLGIDLSRGFKALKVWTALRAHGHRTLGKAISRCCYLAETMGAIIEENEDLELVTPIKLNIICFNAAPMLSDATAQDRVNRDIAQQLQLSGEVVLSTTSINDRTVLRAAITNHRTCGKDIELTIAAVKRTRDSLVCHR